MKKNKTYTLDENLPLLVKKMTSRIGTVSASETVEKSVLMLAKVHTPDLYESFKDGSIDNHESETLKEIADL